MSDKRTVEDAKETNDAEERAIEGMIADQQRTEIDRSPRDHDDRATRDREDDSYLPPNALAVPEPQDGYAFRWIRSSLFDRMDGKNVSKRFREGWVPVRAEDHPELHIMSDIDSRFKDCIECGGLLLCKAPIEMVEKRRAYYRDVNEKQVRAVDENYFRDNDSRVPKFADKQSRIKSFGG